MKRELNELSLLSDCLMRHTHAPIPADEQKLANSVTTNVRLVLC